MFTLEEMIEKCQENSWLKRGALYEEDAAAELEYDYNLVICETLEELMKVMEQGNWPIRQGFAFHNLLFVNQINAEDEWLAIRKNEDGNLIAFDSISLSWILTNEGEAEFMHYIQSLV